MIRGFGDLCLFVDTENYGRVLLPLCGAEFVFSIETLPTPTTFLGTDGIVKTREVGITSETYNLSVSIQDIDYTSLQASFGELSLFTDANTENTTLTLCPLTSAVYSNALLNASGESGTFAYNVSDRQVMRKVDSAPTQKNSYYVDFASNEIEFHADNVGQIIEILITEKNKTFGTIGDVVFELANQTSFEGIFYTTTGDGPYTLVVPKLERISNPTWASDASAMTIDYRAVRSDESDSDRKPFRIYSPTVSSNLGVEQVEILIASFPESFVSGSSIDISGLVTFIENPQSRTPDELNLQAFFGFAAAGSQITNFNSDGAGLFSVQFDVDPLLAHPASSTFSITDTDTGITYFEQAIVTTPDTVPVFGITGIDTVRPNEDVTVSGTAPAGQTVSFTSTDLDGFLDGESVVAEVDGTWTISERTTRTIPNGSGTLTAATTGFSPVNESIAVTGTSFNPTVILDPGSTGILNIFQNDNTVRYNEDINIDIMSPTLAITNYNVDSSNDGSFTGQVTIPVSEAGELITFTFTEVFSGEIKVVQITAPDFDPTLTLTVTSSDPHYTAFDDVDGTITVSAGYDWLVEIRDTTNTTVASTTGTGTGAAQNWSVLLPFGSDAGGWQVLGSAPAHSSDSSVIVVEEGFTAELTSVGVNYPGRTITFGGNGPSGESADTLVFAVLYPTAIPGSKVWSTMVPISGGQAVGDYTADVTVTGRPQTIEVDFTVETVDLSVNCPVNVFSNDTLDVAGRAQPNRVVSIVYSGFGALVAGSPSVDDFANWDDSNALPWLATQAYSISVTTDGPEGPIVCAGTHEAKIDTVALSFIQGDTGNDYVVRGPDNRRLDVITSGDLSSTFSGVTDASGFLTVPFPDVPLETETEQTGNISISTANLTQTVNGTYEILPRVPITITIPSPSITTVADGQVLFISTAFAVTGAIPDTTGAYSLTAVGSAASFTLDAPPAADTYAATLTTSAVPGSTNLTVSTLYQPSVQESFIVSYPLSFIIPASIEADMMYTIEIDSSPNVLVQLRVTGSVVGEILLDTGLTDGSGDRDITLDTTGLLPQTLTFVISNEYFTHDDVTRDLTDGNLYLDTEDEFIILLETETGGIEREDS